MASLLANLIVRSAEDVLPGSSVNFPELGSYRSRAWRLKCAAEPHLDECVNVRGMYHYDIWLAPNAIFVALFILSFLGFVGVYGATRRGVGFTVAMVLGTLLEVLGYAGRVWSHSNRWTRNPFLMQIICLTIAPAFLAAGIYLCLRRIVYAFGAENSRLKPQWYTRIFIPCDIVSLILQATGGALVATADVGESTEVGDGIMMAGLICQIVTMFIFMVLATDFAFNVYRRHSRLGAAALSQDPVLVRIRASAMFKGFLAALVVATVLIFVRCIFRVVEMSGGWHGPLMARQDLLVVFEGVIISIACLTLNVFNPAVACAELMSSVWLKQQREQHEAALTYAKESKASGFSSNEEIRLEQVENGRVPTVTGTQGASNYARQPNNPYNNNGY